MTRKSISYITLGLAVTLALTAIPEKPAHAAVCSDLPQVEWWGNLSHESTVKYVNKRYTGNWILYVAKWRRYHKNMVRIHDEGKTAVVKSRNLRLEGKALADYADKIGERLAAIECLAAQATLADNKAIQDFSTASGETTPAPRPTSRTASTKPNLVHITDEDMNVEIRSSCSDGRATFRVTNKGTGWPKSGRFELFEADGHTPVIERRMRLRSGQSVTFTTQSKSRKTGEVSLTLEPTWRADDDQHRIGIDCQNPRVASEVFVKTG